MRNASVFRALLGVDKVIVERLEVEGDGGVSVARASSARGSRPMRTLPTKLR
jgi:hypothetical protein